MSYERKISMLDEQSVLSEIRHRISKYKYRVRIMATILPVLTKYQGKKVTKHIQTAVNKHLEKNTPKFLGYVRCYLGQYKDELVFQYNDMKCERTGKPLLDYNNQFRVALGTSKWNEPCMAYDDMSKQRNSWIANKEVIAETLVEYENTLADCKAIVRRNNKIYKQLQDLRRDIDRQHSRNAYALQ